MNVTRFEVGPFLENTYLITQGEDNLLIDPGFTTETEFQKFKDELTGKLTAIVLTHAHVDHVLGLSRVRRTFPDAPVYLCDKDYFLWENFGSQAQMFGLQHGGFDFTPKVLPADSEFSIDPFQFSCLYTPGHAPDHLSFYFKDEDILIAGDALFKESIGRTDLYKGSFDLLEASIKEKLYTLPEKVTVYPGHGPETTIGHEKKNNPFVKS